MLDNDLSGSLPPTIGNWASLQGISLGSNRLTSTLPDTIVNWQNLLVFDIGVQDTPNQTNNFTGSLPSTIGEAWSNLQLFSAFNNSLTGQLPESLQAWTDLFYFDVSVNSFEGPLVFIGEWPQMQFFASHSNDFTGTIPQSISSWRVIETATFNDTALEGTVPSGICTAESLMTLAADCLEEVVCMCCSECY